MPTRASAKPTGTVFLLVTAHVSVLHQTRTRLNALLLAVLVSWHRELGDFESAMESFQKALMLDQNHIQSLQLRGMMLYHHGSLQEAIGNFKVPKYNSHQSVKRRRPH